MKFFYTVCLSLVVITQLAFAQVGFNNVNPDPSSVLDLTSTDKGLLIPRLTTTQRLAITSPATSLMVFDTTLGKFCYYSASGQWVTIDNIWTRGTGTDISYTGRVGVNTTTPDASAIMDITATDKGMLVPRMTSAQRTAIASPANSLLVFDTTEGRYYYYTNSQWNTLDNWSKITGGVSYTGQVAVNNTTPDVSSTLDISSTSKGILIPRMTTAQRTAIANPANSLLVFDNTEGRYYYYANSQWNTLDNWTKITGGVAYTGQVGVNNTTPDASSAMDIASTSKGILIPRMTGAQRLAITSPANSLLVFDTTDKIYYYYANNQWNTFGDWSRISGGLSYTGQLGVNNTAPNASAAVEVTSTSKGILIPRMTTTQRLAIASPAASLMVFDTTEGCYYFYTGTQWINFNAFTQPSGSTTATHTGDLVVNGSITATSINGINGVPQGAIIMWSGTTIPTGWHLCDGATGFGITIPNLKGKFIVGYDGTGTGDYGTIGNSGGSKTHTLTIQEMPAHTHTDRWLSSYSGSSVGYGGNTGTLGSAGSTKYESVSTGGGTAFDVRPPYYTLAYIIKL